MGYEQLYVRVAVPAVAVGIWTRVASEDEEQQIDAHRLGAVLRLWAAGKINESTFINTFNLDAGGVSDFSALKTAHDAATDKAEWLHVVEACFLLVHLGDLTEIQAKSILGVV